MSNAYDTARLRTLFEPFTLRDVRQLRCEQRLIHIPTDHPTPGLLTTIYVVKGVNEAAATVAVTNHSFHEEKSFYALGIGGQPEGYIVIIESDESKRLLRSLLGTHQEAARTLQLIDAHRQQGLITF